MSDFMGYHEPAGPSHIDTNLHRPIEDYYSPAAIARDHRASRQSHGTGRVRDVTWISTSQQGLPSSIYPPSESYSGPPPPPPPQPISGIPTPVLGNRGNVPIPRSESEWDEYMTVEPFVEVDENEGYGYSNEVGKRKGGGARNFVGGFVSGLKRLPKAMTKGHLHIRNPMRRDTAGTMDTSQTMLTAATNGTTTSLPRYQSAAPPGGPDFSNVQYVQATDMPVEEPAYASQLTSPRDTRGGRSTLSAVHESPHPSYRSHHSHPSHHSHYSHHTHHSRRSSPHPNHTLHYSREDVRSQSENSTTNTSNPGSPTGAFAQPVLTQAPDYVGMQPPIRMAPHDDSIRHQVGHVRRFLRELNDLPWMSSPITHQYIPGESNGKKYSRQKDTRVHNSWYKPPDNRPLDLLAGSSTTRILPQNAHHAQPHHPGYMPDSSATLAYANAPAGRSPSPTERGSSEGRSAYPAHPYAQQLAYAPQFFVYPQSSSGTVHRPDMQQVRPVYMVANGPPPPFMSPAPPHSFMSPPHPPPDMRYSPHPAHVPQVQHV